MKKVSIEQNLGRKSRCRYPRIAISPVVLKNVILSGDVDQTPLLTQSLTMVGINASEFLASFQESASMYQEGFKVSCIILYTASTKTHSLFFRPPRSRDILSSICRLKRLENLAKVRRKFLILFSFFSSIIYLLDYPFYFSSLLWKTMKQRAGFLRSVKYKRRRSKFSFRYPYRRKKIRAPIPNPLPCRIR